MSLTAQRPDRPTVTEAENTAPPATVDRAFDLMGTHMRVIIGTPVTGEALPPEEAADAVVALLRHYDRTLSRFREDSELCALNRDPRTVVPASRLLREAVTVALRVARDTDGLVDPTVLDDLEAAGYTESWDADRRVELASALRDSAGHRRAATPRADARWQAIHVDDDAGTITRPAGLRIDTGGSGKGHAADLAARLLQDYDAWAIDCGGDLRVGGRLGVLREVEVEDPFTGETCGSMRVRSGAVATSGLRSRIWRGTNGDIAHHLLDPATGYPAFTGVVAATAVAPTAVQAEALAKAALLGGPRRARATLLLRGGIFVTEDGAVHRVGRQEAPPRLRITLPSRPETAA